MKLLNEKIDNGGSGGSVELIPECFDDMYDIFNIVRPGDIVTAFSSRRVTKYTRCTLELAVKVSEIVAFDYNTGELTLKGEVDATNTFCHRGQVHTLFLDVNHKFTLHKEDWDAYDILRLKQSLGVLQSHPDVVVVLANESQGVSNMCLISRSRTVWKVQIKQAIPHKHNGYVTLHNVAMNKFIEKIAVNFIKHVDIKEVKLVVIASNFVVNNLIYDAFITAGEKYAGNAVREQRSKILLTKSSTGYHHGLKEVVSDAVIRKCLHEFKLRDESAVFNEFYELLSSDPGRAVFGRTHTLRASHFIKKLIISDALLRECDVKTRADYISMMTDIQLNGGSVHVLSSLHFCGEQLNLLHGIAAILDYPLPEVEDIPLSGDEE